MNIFDTKLPENSVEYLAIGSLVILGMFEVIDVLTLWATWFNWASGFTVWTLFVSVPILFVTYFSGLLSVLLGEYIFFTIIKRSPNVISDSFIELSVLNNSVLFQKYTEGLRIIRILLGSSLGFLVLAGGVLFQATRQTEGVGLGLRIAGLGLLVIGFICPIVANGIDKQNRHLLNEYKSQSSKNRKNKK
jgi:hypothetical protein